MATFPLEVGEQWPSWLRIALEVSPSLQRMSNRQLRQLVEEWEDAYRSGACFGGSGTYTTSGTHKIRR